MILKLPLFSKNFKHTKETKYFVLLSAIFPSQGTITIVQVMAWWGLSITQKYLILCYEMTLKIVIASDYNCSVFSCEIA